MVSVFVRNDDGANPAGIDPRHAATSLEIPGAESGVQQDCVFSSVKNQGISAAAAAKYGETKHELRTPANRKMVEAEAGL